MRNGIIVAGMLLALRSPGLRAQPAISSVSGTISHDAAVTIIGANFGAKAAAAPLVWEDFSDGAANNLTIHGSLNTNNVNNLRHPFSAKNARGDYKISDGYFGYDNDTASKWFVQYWIKLAPNWHWGVSTYGGPDDGLANIKIFRLFPTGSRNYSNAGYSYQGFSGGALVRFVENGDSYAWLEDLRTYFAVGVWHNVSVQYSENSGVDQPNGTMRLWVDGVLRDSVTNLVTNVGSDGPAINKRPYVIGFYDSWSPSDANVSNMYAYYSDIYVDSSWSRIELGNASTYGNCTLREMQIPTSWSDTSVAITLKQGSFSSGQTAYLYVTDTSGNVNASGYLVTIGGAPPPSPPPDTTLPSVSITSPAGGSTVTASVTVSAAASDNIGVAGVQFLLDGSALGSEATSAPYQSTWDTTLTSSGSHILTARARDAAGNTAISAAIPVSVAISTKFVIGDRIIAQATVYARSTPSLSGTVLQLHPVGELGTVLGGPVSADGIIWWQIDYDAGSDGWSSEPQLGRYVDIAAPSVPAGFSATAVSSTQINLAWSASTDNVAVSGYRVLRGGVLIATTAAVAYQDRGLMASTIYSYLVAAFDAAGNVSANSVAASTRTLTAPDTAAPSVAIAAPSDGSRLAGMVTVAASATDNVGVQGVQFLLDGALLGDEDAAAPFYFPWDTTVVPNGTYVLSAAARDATGNRTVSAPVAVSVRNRRIKVSLALEAPAQAAPLTMLRESDQALLTVKIDDATFPTAATQRARLALPSGEQIADLLQSAQDPTLYYARVSSAALRSADFFALEGALLTLTVGSEIFDAQGSGHQVEPPLGGMVHEPAGSAKVVIRPGGITQPAKFVIQAAPLDVAGRRSAALKRQNLKALDAGREIVMTSSGTLNSAALILPFDPSLIPPGLDARRIRLGYFNPGTGQWEVQDDVLVGADTLQAEVTHFSIYAPVLLLPMLGPAPEDSYVYPNPAVRRDPVIRAFVGIPEKLEIDIYDVSGQKVHAATVAGAPTGALANGSFFYDYTWRDAKASGVYFAVIRAKTPEGPTFRAQTRFAVVH